MASITSANSGFILTATSVFPAPQVLEGYAADDAFMANAVDLAEIVMGVDGKMSAGYTPNPTEFTIALMPDSKSIAVFDAIIAATKATRDVIFLDGVITLPSVGKSYTLSNGVIRNANLLADAKKTMQAQKYILTFERVTQSLLGA